MLALLSQVRGDLRAYAEQLLAAAGILVPAALPTGDTAPLGVTAAGLTEPLSEREQAVLRLLAAGLSNQDIAQALVVAQSTVHWHVKNIYSKLGVHSRTQAALAANVPPRLLGADERMKSVIASMAVSTISVPAAPSRRAQPSCRPGKRSRGLTGPVYPRPAIR